MSRARSPAPCAQDVSRLGVVETGASVIMHDGIALKCTVVNAEHHVTWRGGHSALCERSGMLATWRWERHQVGMGAQPAREKRNQKPSCSYLIESAHLHQKNWPRLPQKVVQRTWPINVRMGCRAPRQGAARYVTASGRRRKRHARVRRGCAAREPRGGV